MSRTPPKLRTATGYYYVRALRAPDGMRVTEFVSCITHRYIQPLRPYPCIRPVAIEGYEPHEGATWAFSPDEPMWIGTRLCDMYGLQLRFEIFLDVDSSMQRLGCAENVVNPSAHTE